MGKVIELRPVNQEDMWEREKRLAQKIMCATVLGDYAAVQRFAKLAEHYDIIVFDEKAIYEENLLNPYE